MLQLGWKAGTEQYGPNELLDLAIAAEAAGFDSIDASDHFHPWAEKGQASFVWSWLGAIAARPSRITLGTGVTCPILRYHPAIVAQAAATVAALAPKRFFLGVGTGEALNEYSATGLWPSYNERRAQLAEAIELIRALWTGEKVTHKGEHYETHEAKLYTLPDEPIPLYISSLVRTSARLRRRIRRRPDHRRWRGTGYLSSEMLRNFRRRDQGSRQEREPHAAHDRARGRVHGRRGSGDRSPQSLLGRHFRARHVHRGDLHARDVREERQDRRRRHDQGSRLFLGGSGRARDNTRGSTSTSVSITSSFIPPVRTSRRSSRSTDATCCRGFAKAKGRNKVAA